MVFITSMTMSMTMSMTFCHAACDESDKHKARCDGSGKSWGSEINATAPSARAVFKLTTSCFHRSSVRIALAANVLYTPQVCEAHMLLISRSSVNEET